MKATSLSYIIFVVVALLLFEGCATVKDSRSGPIENFLEPPSMGRYLSVSSGKFVYKRSIIFIKGIYDKRVAHIREVNKRDLKANSQNAMCARDIEKAIRNFSWPKLWDDFKDEREHIRNELLRLNCYSVT